jgi:hypothetical protein
MAEDFHGTQLGAELIDELRRGFQGAQKLAEGALAQLEDEGEWSVTLDPEANSVAVLVRHVAGNLKSRWADLLTTDGEKPTRDRDGEFEAQRLPVEQMRQEWNEGFATVYGTLDSLTPADMLTVVTLRGQPLSVTAATLRSLAHTSQHVGQIVLLAKHLRSAEWRTLSIPKRR